MEWAGFGRCNTVSPGYIKTKSTDFDSEELRKSREERIPMQ